MKKTLSLLTAFLWALLPALAAFSLLLWRSGAAVSWFVAVPTLCLWAALLTGADRLLRDWGAPLLAIPAALAVFLLADRAAMAEAITAALQHAPVAGSASVSALLLLLAGIVSAAALPLLRCFPLRAALSLLGVLAWLAAAYFSLEPPRPALCALLPILLYTLAELLALRHAESGAPPDALLLLFTAAGALLLAAPTSREPYPYPILNSVIARIETAYHQVETELFYRQQGDAEYALGFNGFSDSESNEGAEKAEEDSFIYLSAAPRTAGVFYLSGSTWNSFDGREWHSTVDRGMIDFLGWHMDTAERLYALWRRNQATPEPCYPDEDQLLFRYFRTNMRTVFTAPDTFFISTSTSRFPYTTRPSRVLFNYVQERDAWYRLFLLRLDGLDPRKLAESSQGYVYDGNSHLTWGAVLRDFNDAYGLSLERGERVESQLAQRESFIRSSYLALPEDTGERVLALAHSLTADCATDLERLTAIENYLRDNYRYTLSPDPVPEGATFLDHLLFDAKEGYCTWYATAAAILARAAGVPTRYVQGYRAELRPGETAVLSESPGHAWCEAYISGYGWVVVEATPGFSSRPAEEMRPEGPAAVDGAPVYLAGAAEKPPETSDEPLAVPSGGARAVLWLPLLAGALLLAAAVFFLLRGRNRRRQYETAPYSERARLDLQRLSVYLARRGYPKQRADSLRDWFSGVRWHYLLLDADEAMRFAVLYEEVLFGGKKLTEAEWLEEKRFVDGLRPRKRLF